MTKDMAFYLLASLFLIIWGCIEIRAGIKSIRKREKAIGIMDPKMALPVGIVILAVGLLWFAKLILIPLIELI